MAHELGGDGFLRAAYDRALADRAFLDTVEGSYTGEYRTIDALWWVAHPGQPTPEGIPAPSSKLRAAEAAAYSSDGSDSLHGKNVAILAELQDHLAAERSAIDKAIRRATGARVDGATSARADETTSPLATGATSALGSGAATDVTGAPLGDATDTDAGADAVPTAGENLSATIKQGQSPANRGWRAVTAALACAVVALIAIDLIRLSTDSATPSPSPNTSVLGLEALKIFSRDPLPSDDSGIQKALAVFHGDFVESSVRQLTYRVQDVLFFAALDPKGLVCFVALDGDAYLSTCTRDSAFLYAPLRLTFTTTVNFPSPATDSFTEAPALVTAEWSPDGTSQGTVERR